MTEEQQDNTIVTDAPIDLQRVAELADASFGDVVKAVVDVRLKLIALGGGLHADEEAALMEQGSAEQDLWGINIYPEKPRPDWIEFESMINVRPRMGNRSRGVVDAETRQLNHRDRRFAD